MSAPSSSRVIISLAAYEENLRLVRACIPVSCRILAVLKADGYGHGAVALARRALRTGVYGIAVATVQEGIEMREAGIRAPIVITVQPLPDAFEYALLHDLELMISDTDTAKALSKTANKMKTCARVHVKIDTGMGRQGIRYDMALDMLEAVYNDPALKIAGVATHFAVADKPEDPFTDIQLDRFRAILQVLSERNITCGLAHAANSAAILRYGASASFDMVRPGLMTFGIPPYDTCPHREQLTPVLRWESRIVAVRTLPEQAPIGYGCTWVTQKPMRIGIVPVGYADGYPVALSNRAEVLVRGKRCRVLGQVSMDQIVVELDSLSDVYAGENVTLIGNDGQEQVTAWELASLCGTIPYEILTGIGRRVERVYMSN